MFDFKYLNITLMANAVFEPFFASLRSNRISFTNCLGVCTDGATINPKEDQ